MFYLILILGLLFIVGVVLKPLVPMIQMKLKYGNNVTIYYFPFTGFFRNFQNSLKNHGDSIAHLKNIAINNPNCKFYMSNIGTSPIVTLLTPDYYKEVLVDHQNYVKFEIFKDNRLVRQGLLHAVGDEWRQQRSLLGHSFTFEELKSRVPLINSSCEEVVQKIQQSGDSTLRTMENFSSITGDIIIRSFFGENLKGTLLNGQPVQIEVANLFAELFLITRRNTFTIIKFMILGQYGWKIFPTKKEKEIYNRVSNLRKFAENQIKLRIEQKGIQENQPIQELHVPDFLDTMVNAYLRQKNQAITVEIMVQQFLGLFFAGTDTTATLLTTSVYHLGKDKQTEQELFEEIQEVIKDNTRVGYDDLSKLHKLNAFIQEVLRLYTPVAGIIARKVAKDVQIKDLKLKKGWYVNFVNVGTCLNSSYFDEPLKFNFKRWFQPQPIKDNENQSFSFIPFSAGGRNCIGQHLALIEAKIILAQFIRTFQFEHVPEAKYKFVNRGPYGVQPAISKIICRK